MMNGLLQFDTLHEIQVRSAEQWADKPLFGTFSEATKNFEYMTNAEFDLKVQACRTMLTNLGVKEGDKVGVISNNRWEWAAVAQAAYGMSAVMCPMYEAQLPSDWSYILNDAQCAALIVANDSIYDRACAEVEREVPHLKKSNILSMTVGEEEGQSDHSFHKHMNLVSNGGKFVTPTAPTPQHLANLIYTSGTTGKPKGVELLHFSQVSNMRGVRALVDDPHEFLNGDDRSLSFLPWAHSYGQTCELWSLMAHGASMGICRGVPVILEDLELVKPSLLYSVPTLYKRVFDGVSNMINTANPIRAGLLKKGLALGAEKAELARKGQELGAIKAWQHNTIDKVALSKIRAKFGGNLRIGFVAGAACPAEIIHFMDAIGIPCCEGYGLTETSPVITISTPDQRKIGTVGKPIGGVECYAIDIVTGERLPAGEDGELVCTGPNIMNGYHNKQEATDEVVEMNKDGKRMFHTGDIGKIDSEGYVLVTGRLKEQFKLENGKYVVPTPVEEAIGMSRFIAQVVLCGANRPYNVVVITPDTPVIAAELKIGEDEVVATNIKVKTLIMNEIANQAESMNLKKFEVPKKFCFSNEPFTVENQMQTPKLSIRRHMVIKNYESGINAMYEDGEEVGGI